MGQKKVANKIEPGAAKEKEAASVKVSSKKSTDTGLVYINASYNNTVVTVTDEKGDVVAWASAGALGFSGPKKATPFAASKVAATLAEKLKKNGPMNVHILVRGVGGGRDSAIRSLANQGFNILSIRDVTPIPHNGPRAPKVRRV